MQREIERFNNFGAEALKQGKINTALAYLRRAAALEPTPPIRCNLAVALSNAGEYAEASHILTDILNENNSNAPAWHAYGVLSLVTGHPDDAIKCFETVVKLHPENGGYKFDLALARMQNGEWRDGFAAYECRRDWKPERVFGDMPRWDGTRGKKIYVWAEQGIGDTLQFARYLPWLASISEKVTFALPAPLIQLFAGYSAICELVEFNALLSRENIECEVALMSLAHFYGTTQTRMPGDPGFIGKSLQGPLVGKTKEKLNIGLCWACNPNSNHYRERSVPLDKLISLTGNPHANFYSLQVGPAAADIVKYNAANLIKDLSSDLADDWCATVAAMQGMDMVVSTDTAVAHLAGILGIPVKMFLARRDWWRWGNEGISTPWYPSMRIFRADKPYDWEAPIKEVAAIIDQAVKNRNSSIMA